MQVRINRKKFNCYAFDIESHNDEESIKNKDICEKSSSLIKTAINCCCIIRDRDSLSQNITNENFKIQCANELIAIKSLIDKISEGFVLVNNALNIFSSYSELNTNCNSEISKRDNLQLGIEADNGTMQYIIRERNEYVLSVGVCPCCGQKITKRNVNSIIENFGE